MNLLVRPCVVRTHVAGPDCHVLAAGRQADGGQVATHRVGGTPAPGCVALAQLSMRVGTPAGKVQLSPLCARQVRP